MSNLLSRFLASQSGATAVEYGLIAALIAGVIIAGVTSMSTQLNAIFMKVHDTLVTPT